MSSIEEMMRDANRQRAALTAERICGEKNNGTSVPSIENKEGHLLKKSVEMDHLKPSIDDDQMSSALDQLMGLSKAKQLGVIVVADFNAIASRLFNVQALLEHCHRKTKSEPIHSALSDAYVGTSDLKDRIIEQIIGLSGVQYEDLNLSSIKGFTPSMTVQAAVELINLGGDIEEIADKLNYSSVCNLAQELVGVGASLNYKLTLDHSDELTKSILDETMSLDYLEKGGKRAVPGEIRTFGGREYIRTVDGWKFHGKGTGKKAQEHVAAHSKKDNIQQSKDKLAIIHSQNSNTHTKATQLLDRVNKNSSLQENEVKGLKRQIQEGNHEWVENFLNRREKNKSSFNNTADDNAILNRGDQIGKTDTGAPIHQYRFKDSWQAKPSNKAIAKYPEAKNLKEGDIVSFKNKKGRYMITGFSKDGADITYQFMGNSKVSGSTQSIAQIDFDSSTESKNSTGESGSSKKEKDDKTPKIKMSSEAQFYDNRDITPEKIAEDLFNEIKSSVKPSSVPHKRDSVEGIKHRLEKLIKPLYWTKYAYTNRNGRGPQHNLWMKHGMFDKVNKDLDSSAKSKLDLNHPQKYSSIHGLARDIKTLREIVDRKKSGDKTFHLGPRGIEDAVRNIEQAKQEIKALLEDQLTTFKK